MQGLLLNLQANTYDIEDNCRASLSSNKKPKE